MGYMNYERKDLRREIEKSKNNFPAHEGRRAYDYHTAAEELHRNLPDKYDVSAEMDIFRRRLGEMPTPDETTGLGRAQAAGIDRQRRKMFSLMDEIHNQIDGDIGKDDFERG